MALTKNVRPPTFVAEAIFFGELASDDIQWTGTEK